MSNVDNAIIALATQFTNSFPEQITPPRTVGREAEYPVVSSTGEAGDVRYLWDLLQAPGDLHEHYDKGTPNLIVALDGTEYNYEIEVGVGTVEIVTRPCTDLFAIQHIMQLGMNRLVRAAARRGWQVLGYGIQPVSPPYLSLMTPKQRYHSLYRAMGAEWLWYTVTASDQCHVAIARPELTLMLNMGNLLAPVLIALCANSPIYKASLSSYCSGREGPMVLNHATGFRHGMPTRPYSSIEDYVRTVAQATHLIVQADNTVIPSARPFTDYLQEHGPDFTAFLFHEHYLWHSARLRTNYGTIEVRPACQQPWGEHMALSVGLIEAAAAIDSYIQAELGPDYWSILRIYHRQVIARGLGAPQPAPHFLRTIVGLAETGLRQRGQGEERLLQPIWNRLERRENPAQRARRIFQTDGLHRLLAELAIRPSII
jgi:gamma-glutamylcysteine synthetase